MDHIHNLEDADLVRVKLNSLIDIINRLPHRDIKDLTADNIRHLHSAPFTLVDAPGVGKFVSISKLTLIYNFGTSGFQSVSGSFVVDPYYTDASGVHISMGLSSAFGALFSNIYITEQGYNGALTALENQPLVLAVATGNTDLIGGSLLTTSLNNGGIDYAPGDTVYIDPDNEACRLVVDTVDGGGAVLTYHLHPDDQGGLSYVPASNVATEASSGSGTGLTINILTTTIGDGTAHIIVEYTIENIS